MFPFPTASSDAICCPIPAWRPGAGTTVITCIPQLHRHLRLPVSAFDVESAIGGILSPLTSLLDHIDVLGSFSVHSFSSFCLPSLVQVPCRFKNCVSQLYPLHDPTLNEVSSLTSPREDGLFLSYCAPSPYY